VIRTLIADDEELSREGIRLFLQREGDFEICAEAVNGPETVAAIRSQRPDLIFLDVQMPGFNGFEVLERAGVAHLPVVVFVTAFDAYAVQAFDAHAVDYLLKPFTNARFREALKRVKDRLTNEPDLELGHRRILDVLDSREAREVEVSRTGQHAYLKRFVVKAQNRYLFLKAEQIEWIESAANYIELHVSGHSHLARMKMGDVEDKLDPAQFVRIHRSTMVNIDYVREVVAESNGEYTVVLADGTSLRMSRSFRSRLLP
jgi:two-component system LytT family response regulator